MPSVVLRVGMASIALTLRRTPRRVQLLRPLNESWEIPDIFNGAKSLEHLITMF